MTEAPEKMFLAVEQDKIDPFWYDEKPEKPSPVIQDIEYRRADLPPKVKALVWDRLGDVFYANGADIEFSFNLQDMRADGGGFNLYLGSTPLTDAEYHIPDDAIAAAQAHYDATILGCLERATSQWNTRAPDPRIAELEADNASLVSIVKNIQDANTTLKDQLAGKWLPIESAPKDKTMVLLFIPHTIGGSVVSAIFQVGKWVDTRTFDYVTPTHWRPLPPAPKGGPNG
jgi:hypothetical protein